MYTSIASVKRTERKIPETIRFDKHHSGTLPKILLFCGILSSLLYVAMNIIVPMYYPGYNSASQTVSELSAIGAPSRQLWILLCTIYSLLVMAFGSGAWLWAGRNEPLRILGILMFFYGFSGFFWPPMHSRETLAAGGKTLTDSLHIVFSIVTVFLMLVMIEFGAAASGKRFRLYSFATIAVFIVFGTLTGLESPGIAANLPTPWIGIWERINIGAFLLWVIVLAVMLLRRQKKSALYYSNQDGPPAS